MTTLPPRTPPTDTRDLEVALESVLDAVFNRVESRTRKRLARLLENLILQEVARAGGIFEEQLSGLFGQASSAAEKFTRSSLQSNTGLFKLLQHAQRNL